MSNLDESYNYTTRNVHLYSRAVLQRNSQCPYDEGYPVSIMS